MFRLPLSFFVLLCAFSASAADFRPLEKFTDGAHQYRLSRNSNAIMGFDSANTLHSTYWAGGIDTRPQAPSRVFHRSWTPSGGWGAQTVIDDSTVSGIGRLGGRHPSLAITPDDSVWIVWADHRHCTENGSWIDNTELYCDVRPAGGAFTSGDYRLTTTAAGTLGDNAYTPKLARDSSGKLHLAWHDYNLNPNVSDIYLSPTGQQTLTSLDAPFSAHRATSASATEFTVPDIAIDTQGARHLVWCAGQGSQEDLYYAVAPAGSNTLSPQVVAAGATDFFDPPHVAVSPAGEVWIAWGDDTGGAAEEIEIIRKRPGQPAFDPQITIEPNPARQYAPSLAVDSQNNLHLAWVDERSGRHVRYARIDSGQSPTPSIQLSAESRLWSRPSLTLDSFDRLYLLVEETTGTDSGELWFATTATPARVETSWEKYR